MMACPPIETGQRFVSSILGHVDCQAMTLGSYGHGALADPNSAVAGALSILLTSFVALFGLRLMYGGAATGRDLLGDVLKIGIVLTLATSWPAWRIMGYDVVLNGFVEIAATIGAGTGLPSNWAELGERLQHVDSGIVSLTTLGSGILDDRSASNPGLIDMATGVALADASGLAWARIVFLAGTIAPIALVRLSAGILLALAPLLAGFLLFAGTRDLFFGWLRALAFCALGALVLAICHAIEVEILESWLQNVMALRGAKVTALSAPTELLVMALAFSAVGCGALMLVARLVFFSAPGLGRMIVDAVRQPRDRHADPATAREAAGGIDGQGDRRTRAQGVADAVAQTLRREAHNSVRERQASGQGPASTTAGSVHIQAFDALGSSHRRTHRRGSLAASRRDAQS